MTPEEKYQERCDHLHPSEIVHTDRKGYVRCKNCGKLLLFEEVVLLKLDELLAR